MINQIVKIERVGRFVDFRKQGQQDFKDLTIVYAENGSGKTTLAEILRSLRENDDAIIQAKHTLGVDEEPRIHIRINGSQNAWFKDWSWTETLENIEIFDATFVNDNIFSGDVVEHRQKKNLYRFVVGEEGVELVRKEERLDDAVGDKKDEIDDLEKEIRKHITSSRSVEEFASLDEDNKIDGKIESQEKRVGRLKKAGEVARKDDLSAVHLPSLQLESLQDLLSRTLDQISENAEKQLQEHLDYCMDEKGEEWIEQGLDYIKEDNCPFCGESVQGLDLVKAYRSYFDDAYKNLKKQIRQERSRIQELLSQNAMIKVQQALAENKTLAEFWKERADVKYDSFSFDEIAGAWKDVQKRLTEIVDQKISAPLEEVTLTSKELSAVEAYEEVGSALEEHNAVVKELNKVIAEAKQETTDGDLGQARKKLKQLQDIKTRQDEQVDKLCKRRKEHIQARNKLVKEKEEAREESAAYTDTVFSKHQDAINRHLENVGAQFRITDIGTRHYGGKPSSRYKIEINDTAVKLGTDKTPREDPKFKTVLSTGDKHTLAFAFFLARLESIELDDKVVVFDDAVTSMDIHREDYAVEQIMKTVRSANQVVVLSHNQHFLHMLESDDRGFSDSSLLKIRRKRDGSIIEPWEIDPETRRSYQKDYDRLARYLEYGPEGNQLSVVRSIRPLLEYFLRIRFPNDFSAPNGLGDYTTAIKRAEPSSYLCSMKDHCEDLEALHEYTKPFMHGADPQAGPDSITDHQLQGYVRRALRVVHGK